VLKAVRVVAKSWSTWSARVNVSETMKASSVACSRWRPASTADPELIVNVAFAAGHPPVPGDPEPLPASGRVETVPSE